MEPLSPIQKKIVEGASDFEYDDNGFVIEKKTIENVVLGDGSESARESVVTYIRDSRGVLEQEVGDDYTKIYNYHENGALDSIELYDPMGDLYSKNTYSYLILNDYYFLVVDIKLENSISFNSSVYILEEEPCHPSQILQVRTDIPDSLTCMDRNLW